MIDWDEVGPLVVEAALRAGIPPPATSAEIMALFR